MCPRNSDPRQTQYSYEPFGKTTMMGYAESNSFQFTGRESDGQTGLAYYRARYYSPSLQRFISEDPLEFAGGDADLYAYIGNAPVDYVDPFGLRRGAIPRRTVPRWRAAPLSYWSAQGQPRSCFVAAP